MNNETLLIDTNVIRRIIEDNVDYKSILDNFMKKDYLIVISDHSLFELFDFLDTLKEDKRIETYCKVLCVFYKYKITLLYRKPSEKFYKNFNDFIFGEYTITEVKRGLFESFKTSLSKFIANLVSVMLATLVNSWDMKSNPILHNSILIIYKFDVVYRSIYESLDSILAIGYFGNELKIYKVIKDLFKHNIIRFLSYYNYISKTPNINTLDDLLSIDKIKVDTEYKKLCAQYQNKNYKDILAEYISEHAFNIGYDASIDDMTKIFLEKYLKNIIVNNKSFSINDCTDYLNFNQAYTKKCLYYTGDTKSLRLYKEIFSEESEIIEYIEKIESIK